MSRSSTDDVAIETWTTRVTPGRCRTCWTTWSRSVPWATTSRSAGTSGPVRGPGGGTAWAGSATVVVGGTVAVGVVLVVVPPVAGLDGALEAGSLEAGSLADGSPSAPWQAVSASAP